MGSICIGGVCSFHLNVNSNDRIWNTHRPPPPPPPLQTHPTMHRHYSTQSPMVSLPGTKRNTGPPACDLSIETRSLALSLDLMIISGTLFLWRASICLVTWEHRGDRIRSISGFSFVFLFSSSFKCLGVLGGLYPKWWIQFESDYRNFNPERGTVIKPFSVIPGTTCCLSATNRACKS